MLGMHVVNECLLVPLGHSPDDEAIRQLQAEVLSQIQATTVKGVLLDMSAVRLLDSSTFILLVNLARTASLMGVDPIFVGFRAGVAGALIDLNVDIANLRTVVNLADAFELLQGPAVAPVADDDHRPAAPGDDRDDPDDPS